MKATEAADITAIDSTSFSVQVKDATASSMQQARHLSFVLPPFLIHCFTNGKGLGEMWEAGKVSRHQTNACLFGVVGVCGCFVFFLSLLLLFTL